MRLRGPFVPAVAAAALLASCAPSWPASTWRDLEKLASTYPVPSTLSIVGISREGQLCRSTGCETPRVTIELSAKIRSSPTDLCSTLKDSLLDWPGYKSIERKTIDRYRCPQFGSVRSRSVDALVFPPVHASPTDPDLAINIWATPNR